MCTTTSTKCVIIAPVRTAVKLYALQMPLYEEKEKDEDITAKGKIKNEGKIKKIRSKN